MRTRTKIAIAVALIGTIAGAIFIAIAVKVADLSIFDKIGRIVIGLLIIAVTHFLARLIKGRKRPEMPPMQNQPPMQPQGQAPMPPMEQSGMQQAAPGGQAPMPPAGDMPAGPDGQLPPQGSYNPNH